MRKVDVTPQQAQAWLDTRPLTNWIDLNKVERYRQKMDRGEWDPLPESPITFDPFGRLYQGHHRLTAVVQLNQTITFWVTDHETFRRLYPPVSQPV